MSQPDVSVLNCGSIVILTPITEEAQQWCAENLQKEAVMWGDGYAVEARYAPYILAGMMAAALVLE